VADERSVTVLSFGADGTVTSVVSELDHGNDGVIDEANTITWDHGWIIGWTTSVDNDADGNIDQTWIESVTRDAAGNVLARISDTLAGDGTLQRRRTDTIVYDAEGNRLTETTEEDNDGDGSPEYRYASDYTYVAGDLVASTHQIYIGTAPDPYYLVDTSCTYDGAHHRLGCVNSIDSNADGVENVREVETNTYDPDGHQLSHRFERQDGIYISIQATTAAAG
jgi:hypothetical protein